jgi:hypothetical protein
MCRNLSFHQLFDTPKETSGSPQIVPKKSPEFAMVDRIAHAFKHVQSEPDKSAHLQPLKAGDVIERPPAKWGKAVWGLSRWGDAIGGVTIGMNMSTISLKS